MTQVGPNATGTGSTLSTGGAAWSNPTNIEANDSSYATSSPTSGLTNALVASNFGFSIPAGATINGVQVDITRHASALNTFKDSLVKLTANAGTGVITGCANKASASNWGTSDADVSYGGSADTWSISAANLTSSVVNGSGFGVVFEGAWVIGTPTASVNYISVTVWYSAGGPPMNQMIMMGVGS